SIEPVRGSVFTENRPTVNAEHPTMKPVALVERMLANSCRRGDRVLDPFGGSGSTLIACEALGLKAHLLELDPRYVDVIVTRWEQLTGKKAERAKSAVVKEAKKAKEATRPVRPSKEA